MPQQRNKDNYYLARCSKILRLHEKSEGKKSEVCFHITEESKSNSVAITQSKSKEFILNNKNYSINMLSENQKNSYKDIPHSNFNSSGSPRSIMNNQQTPIKSNISTNLSFYTSQSEKVYVDVFDNDEESNYYEIADKETECKKLSL